jgi:hypothetical protein
MAAASRRAAALALCAMSYSPARRRPIGAARRGA